MISSFSFAISFFLFFFFCRNQVVCTQIFFSVFSMLIQSIHSFNIFFYCFSLLFLPLYSNSRSSFKLSVTKCSDIAGKNYTVGSFYVQNQRYQMSILQCSVALVYFSVISLFHDLYCYFLLFFFFSFLKNTFLFDNPTLYFF